MEMQQLVAVAAVFVVAGTVKGVTGLGLPTVAIAGLSMVLPLAQAAALLVLPSLLTNVWQYLRCGVAWAVWRRTRGLCLGTAAGAWLSPLPEVASAGPWAQALTGGLLAFYGLAGLVGLRLPPPGFPWSTTSSTTPPSSCSSSFFPLVLPLSFRLPATA